jgi:hypothetical protein
VSNDAIEDLDGKTIRKWQSGLSSRIMKITLIGSNICTISRKMIRNIALAV